MYHLCSHIALLASLLALIIPIHAAAREGDTRTTLFVGTTTHTDGKASTFGTTIGLKWSLEFQQDWLWTISGAYAATDGEQIAGDQTYDISARTTNLDSGIIYLFNNEPDSAIVGMLGAGGSILWYDLEYTYPGAEVGDTSGVGPGIYGLVGAEVRLTRNFHFIPQYVAGAHFIKAEDGDRFTLTSAQLLVALRLSF